MLPSFGRVSVQAHASDSSGVDVSDNSVFRKPIVGNSGLSMPTLSRHGNVDVGASGNTYLKPSTASRIEGSFCNSASVTNGPTPPPLNPTVHSAPTSTPAFRSPPTSIGCHGGDGSYDGADHSKCCPKYEPHSPAPEGDHNIILMTDGYKFSHHKQYPVSWLPEYKRSEAPPKGPPIIGTKTKVYDVQLLPDGKHVAFITNEGTSYGEMDTTKDASVQKHNQKPIAIFEHGRQIYVKTHSKQHDDCNPSTPNSQDTDSNIYVRVNGTLMKIPNRDTLKRKKGSDFDFGEGALNVSYFTPRAYKDQFKDLGIPDSEPAIVFFGLQYFLKRYIEGEVVTREKIDAAAEFVYKYMADVTKPGPQGYDHSMFPRGDWEAILTGDYENDGKVYEGAVPGHLPIKVEALPEGSIVKPGVCCFKITNTHPRFFWLPNYLETFLVQVWYPMTIATQAREFRKIIQSYSIMCGRVAPGIPGVDAPVEVPEKIQETDSGGQPTERKLTEDENKKYQEAYQKAVDKLTFNSKNLENPTLGLATSQVFDLVDFGYRGVSSHETAGLGSAAYYTSGYEGSDTVAGANMVLKYYNPHGKAQTWFNEHHATSLPAAEHSTVTSWCDMDVPQLETDKDTPGKVKATDASSNITGGVDEQLMKETAAFQQIGTSSIQNAIMQIDTLLIRASKSKKDDEFKANYNALIQQRKKIQEAQSNFKRDIADKVKTTMGNPTVTLAQVHEYLAFKHQLDEQMAFVNFMTQYHESFAVSLVSDGFNIWNSVYNQWTTPEMKHLVCDRKMNGRLTLLRPDSGEAVESLPQLLTALKETYEESNLPIAKKPASTPNGKESYETAYIWSRQPRNLLNDGTHIQGSYNYFDGQLFRILQGDGVALGSVERMCASIVANGFCISTVHFGSGGGLLQKVNRDTLSCAFKCCAMYPYDNGKQQPMRKIGKAPIAGGKTSFAGDPMVVEKTESITTRAGNTTRTFYDNESVGTPGKTSVLEMVMYNGCMHKQYDITDVIATSKIKTHELQDAHTRLKQRYNDHGYAEYNVFTQQEKMTTRKLEARLGSLWKATAVAPLFEPATDMPNGTNTREKLKQHVDTLQVEYKETIDPEDHKQELQKLKNWINKPIEFKLKRKSNETSDSTSDTMAKPEFSGLHDGKVIEL